MEKKTPQGNIPKGESSDISSRGSDLPSLPQPHDRNRNTPRIRRRASISQRIALDRKIKRNIQSARFEEAKRHVVHILRGQLRDVSRNLKLEQWELALWCFDRPLDITHHRRRKQRKDFQAVEVGSSGAGQVVPGCGGELGFPDFEVGAWHGFGGGVGGFVHEACHAVEVGDEGEGEGAGDGVEGVVVGWWRGGGGHGCELGFGFSSC